MGIICLKSLEEWKYYNVEKIQQNIFTNPNPTHWSFCLDYGNLQAVIPARMVFGLNFFFQNTELQRAKI